MDKQSTQETSFPKYLNTRDAARFLGVTVDTVRRWRWVGTGCRYFRQGDSPKAPCAYLVSDLIAWRNERLFSSTAEETEMWAREGAVESGKGGA